MFNKKAQGMSTNTIILLVLGLAVLVVLILGFTTGWKTFKSLAQPTNVDGVVDECVSVCSLDQTYGFCSSERLVRVNEEDLEIKTSCLVLANLPKFETYFNECPGIQCDLSCEQIVINDKKGSTELTEGYDVSPLVTEENCFVPN